MCVLVVSPPSAFILAQVLLDMIARLTKVAKEVERNEKK